MIRAFRPDGIDLAGVNRTRGRCRGPMRSMYPTADSQDYPQ